MRRPRTVAAVALGLVVLSVVAGPLVGGGGGLDAQLAERDRSGEGGSADTVLTTVLAGVAVFVIGQAIQRFVIEPIQEQKKVLGEVVFAVRYYSSGTRNYGVGPGPTHYEGGRSTREAQEVRKEASETLYKLSAKVSSSLSSVPGYRVFERLGFVEENETVEEVALELKGWALYVTVGNRSAAYRHWQAVARALDIPWA